VKKLVGPGWTVGICMDSCQCFYKVINVPGLNAEFVPLLLVLISEFFTVLMIYQCVKRVDSFTNQFPLNYLIQIGAILSAVKIWVLWDVMRTVVHSRKQQYRESNHIRNTMRLIVQIYSE